MKIFKKAGLGANFTGFYKKRVWYIIDKKSSYWILSQTVKPSFNDTTAFFWAKSNNRTRG